MSSRFPWRRAESLRRAGPHLNSLTTSSASYSTTSAMASSTIPLHHCKFVDYTPSSVTAVAFPPLPLQAPPSSQAGPASASSARSDGKVKEHEMGVMAVGKGNGDVDILKWVDRVDGAQGWVFYRVGPLS